MSQILCLVLKYLTQLLFCLDDGLINDEDGEEVIEALTNSDSITELLQRARTDIGPAMMGQATSTATKKRQGKNLIQ